MYFLPFYHQPTNIIDKASTNPLRFLLWDTPWKTYISGCLGLGHSGPMDHPKIPSEPKSVGASLSLKVITIRSFKAVGSGIVNLGEVWGREFSVPYSSLLGRMSRDGFVRINGDRINGAFQLFHVLINGDFVGVIIHLQISWDILWGITV